MSDPLSVAGTAVGIISLGLQVCGEIVSFCQAYRGFDEDIQLIGEKADGLRQPLRVLRRIIEDFGTTDPTIASDLEKKAKTIERVIQRLKKATDGYSSLPCDRVSFRFQLKKAAYPFRKEGLSGMANDLDSVQAMLNTAILIYSTQSTRDLLWKMTQEVQGMHLTLQNFPKQYKPPPSLLQSWLAQSKHLIPASSPLQPTTHGDNMSSSTCIKLTPDEAASIKTESTHEESPMGPTPNSTGNRCVSRSYTSRNEREVVKASYYYCSHMLNLAIRASFLITKGAGGYSIAPSLHFRSVVGFEGSVIGRIIINAMYSPYLARKDSGLLVDQILQQLQEAFDLRKASPYDRVVLSGEEHSTFDVFFVMFDMMIQSHLYHIFGAILNFLMDHGSIPDTHHQRTASVPWNSTLSLFTKNQSLGLRLLKQGMQFPMSLPRSLADRQYLQQMLNQNYDTSNIPDPIRIVVGEYEDELKDALLSGTELSNDLDFLSFTMIHYAYGWPTGIQILLQAGAIPHPLGTPLPYIEDDINGNVYHSATLLLQAGWTLSWYDLLENQLPKGKSKLKLLLLNELVTRHKRLWDLAQACLPAGEFPKMITENETTGEITILHLYATEIQRQLKWQGVAIDPTLESLASDSYLPYHSSSGDVEVLEELWQAGFRGVTQLNSEGLMPLMLALNDMNSTRVPFLWRKLMEKLDWLISKGADPYQSPSGSSATAAHHVGLLIVESILRFLEQRSLISLDLHLRQDYECWEQSVSECAKRIFLLPAVRDDCTCPCSVDGCTTMSVFLRHIFKIFSSTNLIKEPSLWFQKLIGFALWWIKEDTDRQWEVVRSLTFDALGLKHSCCVNGKYDHNFEPWDGLKLRDREEEDVDEILEEQKPAIIQLESLLAEMKAKMDDLGHPVMQFLEGYWYTRMIEVLSHRDAYNEKHIKESRQIGVILEPEELFVPDRVSLLIGAKVHEICT